MLPVHNDSGRVASLLGRSTASMLPFPEGTFALLVVWLAILAVLVAVGVYLIGKFRDKGAVRNNASELMTNFQQLHDQGELSDAEYRTIKAMLSEQLHNEVSSDGKSA